MPTLSSTQSFTTPSVTVPPNSQNPYIVRTTNPSGTVFIAVGAIVGVILLGFILYHLIVSLSASRLAKKSVYDDKQIFENYQSNNNTAYGLTPSTTFTFGNPNQSIAKLPLLNGSKTGLTSSGSQLGDTSTLYQSDVGVPTSKHDLTKMFISPTEEVMTHHRAKSTQFGGSIANLNILNGSNSNLASPGQHVPSLYMNNETNNSDYSLSTNTKSQTQSNRASHLSNLGAASAGADNSLNVKHNRKTIPSMYLEDLIDE